MYARDNRLIEELEGIREKVREA